MYNHNKAQQSKNRVHISWDILYECRVRIPLPVIQLRSYDCVAVYLIADDRSLLILKVMVLDQCDHTKMRLNDDSLKRKLQREIYKAWLVETYNTSHNIRILSMMTSWYGNAFCVLRGPWWGEITGHWQGVIDVSFEIYFVRLYKLLNKRIVGNFRRHESHVTSLWCYLCVWFYFALVCLLVALTIVVFISFCAWIIVSLTD